MTTSSILISIVIPAYNEENQIIFLLKSLLNQTISNNFEIIVVDNESNDNTVRDVLEFKKLKGINNLKIISSKGKLGKARNDGVLNANGKWIAFIDADEVADPNWLKELIKKSGEYDIIMGSIKTSNPKVNFISSFFHLLHLERIKYLNENRKIRVFGTGNLLINKKIFEKGIYFDNNFPTAEDGDFSYTLSQRGYKFGYCKRAVIYHKIPETIKQLYYFQKKMIIGKLLLFLKHQDFYSLLKVITNIFYFVSPNFYKIYKKNRILSKRQFLLIGLTSFLISLYSYLNPIILFGTKKKITRLK